MIQVNECVPLPGRSTTAAMEAGIFRAVVHGIRSMIYEMLQGLEHTDIFLAGGDAYRLAKELRGLLVPSLARHFRTVPFLTLEGIRIAAEALL
jgi:pantothenate kinase type III